MIRTSLGRTGGTGLMPSLLDMGIWRLTKKVKWGHDLALGASMKYICALQLIM
jgi:hypothetical protein